MRKVVQGSGRDVPGAVERCFQSLEKGRRIFSNVWKIRGHFFQCLENRPSVFSNVWKNRAGFFQCLENPGPFFPMVGKYAEVEPALASPGWASRSRPVSWRPSPAAQPTYAAKVTLRISIRPDQKSQGLKQPTFSSAEAPFRSETTPRPAGTRTIRADGGRP